VRQQCDAAVREGRPECAVFKQAVNAEFHGRGSGSGGLEVQDEALGVVEFWARVGVVERPE
jgi:hypothetical protein